MKIDGRLIASQIKADLKEKISSLRQKNIIPQLAVILIGNDPGSEAYVRQKLKVGEEIGAKVSLFNFSESGQNTSGVTGWSGSGSHGSPDGEEIRKKLIKLVHKLNNDPSVHGIIIQRPVPLDIPKEELDLMVVPAKDVDGFHPQSPFHAPIANAVVKILEWVQKAIKPPRGETAVKTPQGWPEDSPGVEKKSKDFIAWLQKQKILVIGRGETAGKPIAETLRKMGLSVEIAHSKTANLEELCLASDIIITCVGRADIVRHSMVNGKTILIGVGLHQEEGKLKTDYREEEVADKAAYYTPVPGGVGPVNVACLFENLLKSKLIV